MNNIPEEIINVIKELEAHKFEGFLIGGCVRDLLRGKEPKDWDVTTNATPEQIQQVFPDSFYENDFGTVGVKVETDDPRMQVIEVTPYRMESTYSDNRRPDEVVFSKRIEEDLERRDFTMNAIGYNPLNKRIVDLHGGQEDIEKKLIKTVGDPDERFAEDALRMMRAIRLSTELDFTIESDTFNSISKNADLIQKISKERVRDEFSKIIMSDSPMIGMVMLEKVGILSHILPVFLETMGVDQNKEAHKYDVWEHLLRSLQHAADKHYPLEVRLAALFHDISKPETKRVDKKGNTSFYGHEVVGARVTRETLRSLKFSKDIIDTVTSLVRWHMFFADPDKITLSAVRRIITKVGEGQIENLMNLRICDRIGTGRPKEEPYRFRKYKSMIDEASRDPLSVAMLEVSGETLMKELEIKPGPKIGHILHALLEEVLDDPNKNKKDILLERAGELIKLKDKELAELGKKGRVRAQEEDEEIIKDIRSKHHVK